MTPDIRQDFYSAPFVNTEFIPGSSQPNLAKAFVAFWGAVRNARKDRQNPHHKNDYATLESVLGTIKDEANKNGLAFPQFLGRTENGQISVTTKVVHESGEEWNFISSFPLSDAGFNQKRNAPNPIGPQQGASASTYLKRYALLAVCGMVGSDEEDDDGEAAHEEPEATDDSTPEEVQPPPPMTAAEQANLKRAIGNFKVKDGEEPAAALARLKEELEPEVRRAGEEGNEELVNAYVAVRDAIRPPKKKAAKK